jgi:hypothetical protein
MPPYFKSALLATMPNAHKALIPLNIPLDIDNNKLFMEAIAKHSNIFLKEMINDRPKMLHYFDPRILECLLQSASPDLQNIFIKSIKLIPRIEDQLGEYRTIAFKHRSSYPLVAKAFFTF